MYYVGIDVGGTGVKAGVVDESGRIIAKATIKTAVEKGADAVMEDMAEVAGQAVEKAGLTMEEIEAIGIGIPGVLDPATGIVPFCTNLGWHQVPVIERMHELTGRPIYVDNDATVAALAESVAGVSAGVKNSVFLTLGTGVGGGIVIDGKVYSGTHGVASELGHHITHMGGEKCTCGNRGCWERYASATALIRMGKEAAAAHPESALAKFTDLTAKDVVDSAKAGDETALAVFDQYTEELALGMANIINFLDPEIIAIGGGVSAAGEFLLEPIRQKLKKYVFYKDLPYSEIKLATMGNDAGIVGAAMLGRKDA